MKASSPRPWLPLVLIVLGLLLLVSYEAGILAPFENLLHYVLDPLQRVTSGLFDFSGTLFQSVREVRALRTEAEELQARVDALTVENIRLREYEAEVQQLRNMLNFVSEYPVAAPLGADVVSRQACETFPCGEVIGTDPNPYLRYITINVGASQGVEVGMPVVTGGAALVGRVVQVRPRTSQVQLLNDVDSAVSALLQRTRSTGLVVGEPQGTLRMDYVAQDEDVQEGDIVLTSGLGGVMPKGLVVGQVVQVEDVEYELFQPIVVRPAVDFSRIELVLVITGFEQIPLDEPLPTEEAPVEAE
jgi:rod shape-determining protein MreC